MKLTLPQQDVYFEQLLYPGEPVYNIGAKITIKGSLKYEILNEAYIGLINQHDAYRSIIQKNKTNVQVKILRQHTSDLEYKDFSKTKNPEKLALDFMQDLFVQNFDLDAQKPLHQFVLIKVNQTYYYLFSRYHHIITDGWGTSLMFQRLVENYNELEKYGQIQSDYPFSYKDFVQDDQKYHASDDFDKDKAYWKERFQILPERLFEKLKIKNPQTRSDRKELIIKRSTYNSLIQIANGFKSSTFHIILGILFLYFGRKHGNKDFAIGIPVLNRGKAIFKKTVGLFMGITALRMKFNFEDTFEDLVRNIRQQLRQDYRHQRFPLGKLIGELELFEERDRLFNIMLSYEKQNYADHFINTTTTVIPMTHMAERVALAVYIREFDVTEDVKIDFDYNLDYFNAETVSNVLEHIEHLIKGIIGNSTKKLADYKYLTPAEEGKLLNEFNGAKMDLCQKNTFLTLYKEQVKTNAHRIAVFDNNQTYSYEQFDLESKKIATFILNQLKDDKGSPIAVLMNRSADLVSVLMGILKSGRAFIPLDPTLPINRLNLILKDARTKYIICDNKLEFSLDHKANFVDFYTIANYEIKTLKNQFKEPKSTDTAYVIYTSGTTGEPKGVEIGHKSLLNILLSLRKNPGITTKDLLFAVTTQSFDVSIAEMFAPLISGATIYIADNDILKKPSNLIDRLNHIKPTILQSTPSFYQMLYNAGWTGDKKIRIFCGGDLLRESLAKKLLKSNAELWNMYGPTETTIYSSISKVTSSTEASSIGFPIDNTKMYILDECLRLQPIGIAGTIFIGGHGLAKGYYSNKKLTKEKFITNPFNEKGKIYNTGDLGKWNKKGEIEFIGRNDGQVKVRGYRIEVGDIENTMNALKGVKSSVVVSKKSEDLEDHLVAYVIYENKIYEPEDIINLIKKELPEYMVPYIIIGLNNFPLTLNGKIDRKLLAEKRIDISRTSKTFNEPKNNLELELYGFYEEVLQMDKPFSITDNFFSLGGHSLNAVRLISTIEKKLKYQLSLRNVFDYPSIEKLANYLRQINPIESETIEVIKERPYYPISKSQYFIWLASQKSHKSIAYNMNAVYKVEGKLDRSLLEQAFLYIIKKYDVLKSYFVELNGTPYQHIHPEEKLTFKIGFDIIENVKIAIKMFINREFDFEGELLLRAKLFEDNHGKTFIAFSTHHIIMDGWSLEIMINEVIKYYNSLFNNRMLKSNILDFQFRDYVAWQNSTENKHERQSKKFWRNYLKSYEWKTLINSDSGDLEKEPLGAVHYLIWGKDFISKLKTKIQERSVTLHTLLLSGLILLIHQKYDHDDICIGTINSGRTVPSLKSQIGMFVKTLPLRSKINPTQIIGNFLQEVQSNLLELDEHQDIPEDIQRKIRLEIILVLQNQSFNFEHLSLNENVQLNKCHVESDYSRLPMLISFSESESYFEGLVSFDRTLFRHENVELFFFRYKKIIESLIANIDSPISTIGIDLTSEESEAIEINFNF